MLEVDYDRLDQALVDCGSEYHAAEAHGILCGLVAVGHESPEAVWAELTLDPDRAQAAPDISIAQFATLAGPALEKDDFSFQLLLPDDDEALTQRARALGDWCQGFLFGWGMGGARSLNEEQTEILGDLEAIARVSEEVDEDEEGEHSLLEVVEFVRTAVMVLFEARRQEEGGGAEPTLH